MTQSVTITEQLAGQTTHAQSPSGDLPGERTRAALVDLETAQARQAKFAAQAAAKQAELRDLEERVGAEVLAAPDDQAEATAARLSAEAAGLRASMDVDVRTAAAAEAKVEQQRLSLYAAEAEDVAVLRAAAQRAIEEHQRKTDRLLKQLLEHDGAEYAIAPLATDSFGERPPGSVHSVPRGTQLRNAVQRLSARLVLLQIAAQGRKLPTFARLLQIPRDLYSPRLADAPVGRDAQAHVGMMQGLDVDPALIEDLDHQTYRSI